MFTSRLSIDEWLSDRYDELGDMSVRAGIPIQEIRDAAVVRDKIERALGTKSADVIEFPIRSAQ